MKETRVMVRRERPSALAWSIALAVTMLAVYVLTWTAAQPGVARVSAAPRVTREIELEALKGWCVTLGAFPDAGRARMEAAGCASRGAAGGVYKSDGTWRVLGAMYATEAQARRVAKKLGNGNGISADVLEMEAPEVALRITAPQPQIELIEAADEFLREQVGQLSGFAGQLEKGQLQPDVMRTLCALSATEAAAMAEKLNVFPGASKDALCGALMKRLNALSGQLKAIAGTGQTAIPALAGMLRLSAIDDFMGMVEMRNALLKHGN